MEEETEPPQTTFCRENACPPQYTNTQKTSVHFKGVPTLKETTDVCTVSTPGRYQLKSHYKARWCKFGFQKLDAPLTMNTS